jgi:hypothetical protein
MEVFSMNKVVPCLLIASALVACSRSESSEEAQGAGVGTEVTSKGEVQPSERPTVGDGTVRVKAGNTDVVVTKDGVTTGGVKVDKDGVKTGGATVDKDGVKTGGATVDKDGVKAGGVTVKKDGTVVVPGVP